MGHAAPFFIGRNYALFGKLLCPFRQVIFTNTLLPMPFLACYCALFGKFYLNTGQIRLFRYALFGKLLCPFWKFTVPFLEIRVAKKGAESCQKGCRLGKTVPFLDEKVAKKGTNNIYRGI